MEGVVEHRLAFRRLLALGLAALLALSGCSLKEEPTKNRSMPLRIAVTTFPASAPVYVADEQGYFSDEGLDVELVHYGTGSLGLADAVAGKVDVALAAETAAARSALDGHQYSIVATIARVDSANYLVARADRGIERVKDLAGKKVGVVPGTTGQFFLHILLVSNGVDPSTVDEVPLAPGELTRALVAREVDAISSWMPYTTQAEHALGSDTRILDEPGLYTMSWNLVTGYRYGEGHPEELARLLRAIQKARDYLEEHPDEGRALTARRCGLNEADLRRHWADYRWTNQLDQSLLLELEDEARWMRSISATPLVEPDFLGYIDSSALRRVNPRDVTIIEVAAR